LRLSRYVTRRRDDERVVGFGTDDLTPSSFAPAGQRKGPMRYRVTYGFEPDRESRAYVGVMVDKGLGVQYLHWGNLAAGTANFITPSVVVRKNDPRPEWACRTVIGFLHHERHRVAPPPSRDNGNGGQVMPIGSEGRGISANGTMVVTAFYHGWHDAFVVRDESYTSLSDRAGLTWSECWDISAGGLVAFYGGSNRANEADSRAYLYDSITNGDPVPLHGLPNAVGTTVTAVNDAGFVVGSCGSGDRLSAVMYAPGAADPTKLPVYTLGATTEARAVSPSGDIIGFYDEFWPGGRRDAGFVYWASEDVLEIVPFRPKGITSWGYVVGYEKGAPDRAVGYLRGSPPFPLDSVVESHAAEGTPPGLRQGFIVTRAWGVSETGVIGARLDLPNATNIEAVLGYSAALLPLY
jgi:hypothetical protein